MQALVLDGAKAVYGELGDALLQQDGHNVYALLTGGVRLSEVVDEAGGSERVHHAQVLHTGRIVVVAVYAEDGYGDVEVGIVEVGVRKAGVAEVDVLVADYLELDGLGAEAVLAQHLLTLGEAVARRLVLVKQIAAEQYEVDELLFADGERLVERDERVGAALCVLLHVAEVVVRGHQQAEHVARILRLEVVLLVLVVVVDHVVIVAGSSVSPAVHCVCLSSSSIV